jgi:hypothetical protein
MAKKAISKQSGNPASKRNVLESITGEDALAILKVLAARDRRQERKIEEVAIEHFSTVEMDAIAADVVMELEALDVDEVWDRSGSSRDEYVEPSEAASEMLEEALQPFRDEVAKYQRLSMLNEAELICQGILKGIYDFDAESTSEFKDWAMDAPSEYFGEVLHDWKKLFGLSPPVQRGADFLRTHCPKWAEQGAKSLRRSRK